MTGGVLNSYIIVRRPKVDPIREQEEKICCAVHVERN